MNERGGGGGGSAPPPLLSEVSAALIITWWATARSSFRLITEGERERKRGRKKKRFVSAAAARICIYSHFLSAARLQLAGFLGGFVWRRYRQRGCRSLAEVSPHIIYMQSELFSLIHCVIIHVAAVERVKRLIKNGFLYLMGSVWKVQFHISLHTVRAAILYWMCTMLQQIQPSHPVYICTHMYCIYISPVQHTGTLLQIISVITQGWIQDCNQGAHKRSCVQGSEPTTTCTY